MNGETVNQQGTHGLLADTDLGTQSFVCQLLAWVFKNAPLYLPQRLSDLEYRLPHPGTSLIRNHLPLGPYSRPIAGEYRGTSLVRNRLHLGPCSKAMHMGALGRLAFSYERGTPVSPLSDLSRS